MIRHLDGSSAVAVNATNSSIRPDPLHQSMCSSCTPAFRYHDVACVDCSPTSTTHDLWLASLMKPTSVGSKPGEKYRYDDPYRSTPPVLPTQICAADPDRSVRDVSSTLWSSG